MIETSDLKIVLASVGSKKFNDYPDSIAAILGEQIELTEFLSQNSYNDCFLNIWVKRACIEEFCLTDLQYQILFDKTSIRLLGVTFEGDIYNFAMATTIKLNVSFHEFYTVIKTSFKQMEVNYLYPLDITEISKFILNKGKFDYIGSNFEKHPSTDYRLLLIYLHHYGLRHGCQKIVKCSKRKANKKK